jgi:hypothetical protein
MFQLQNFYKKLLQFCKKQSKFYLNKNLKKPVELAGDGAANNSKRNE